METTEGSVLCVTHRESARQPHRGVAQTLSTEGFSVANISAALRELHCNLTEGLQFHDAHRELASRDHRGI